ncbi:MAG: S1/P1 Nuclease, partial [Bacteroidetes bacterium]|nr:S1/P1 Nuclease [Bacteroidota bacterium]
MFRWILIPACLVLPLTGWSWGFYAHKKINRIAIFLLPPEMLVLYKKHLVFIEEHAVDPDKRRYLVKEEG